MIPIPNISIAAAAKVGGLLLGLLALILLIHDRNHWKADATLRQQQLAESKAAFNQTVAGYRAAAAQAQQADAANAVRVRSEQAQISERTQDEFETRIAAARTDAQRLRDREAAAAHSGGGAGAPVSLLPAPAPGVAQTAREDELSESDRLTATEQAIQLDELIKWVQRQHEVDNTGGSASIAGNQRP